MSNEALTLVSKSEIHPSGRKFVMMALADYADERWSCFPSIDHLARYTAQSNRTVQTHLDGLEEAGIITRFRPRRDDGTLAGYRYTIHRKNLPVANFASGEKQQEPPEKVAGHYPPIEPPIINSKLTPMKALRLVLDEQRAQAVVDHRKGLRKPLTAHAAKLLADKFAKCPDANAAADTMIGNGWQGFEPSWLDRPRQQAGPAPKNTAQSIASDLAKRMQNADPNSVDLSNQPPALSLPGK